MSEHVHAPHYSLAVLHAVCTAWTGAVSASVYLPLINGSISPLSTVQYPSKDDAVQAVKQLHDKLKGLHEWLGQQPAFDATTQGTASWMCSSWQRTYPQSTWTTSGTPTRSTPCATLHWTPPPPRYAVHVVMHASTTLYQLVLLLDGDFVVGPAGAHERLQSQYRELMHVTRHSGLVVLPAFKASHEQWGTDHAAELLTWLLSGMLSHAAYAVCLH